MTLKRKIPSSKKDTRPSFVDPQLMQGRVVDPSCGVTADEAKSSGLTATIASMSKEARDALMPKLNRGFFDNNDVDEAVKALQSSRLYNVSAASFSKPVISVPECVSQEFESYLTSHFREYVIRFTRGNSRGHSNAAAFRRITRFHVRDLLGYTRNAKVPEGYDMLLKDVGSSVYDVLNDELDNVHCCMPDLDFRDHTRHAKFKNWLFRHDCKNSQVHKKICNGLKTGQTLYRCESKSQDCYVKAPFLCFIHSAYDMTAVDIVDCMIAANATRAAIVMHFDDTIITGATHGVNDFLGYEWNIVVNKGVKYFQQNFFGDVQSFYSHRLDVMLDKIFTPLVVGSDFHPYLFELREVSCGTLIIEVFRREARNVIGGTWRFSLPRTAPENTVTLHTYEYVLGWEKFFACPCKLSVANMRPVTLTVPSKYYYDCFRYGLTVDSSKFVLEAISKGNIAIAARRNLGGTTMVDPEIPMPREKQILFNVTMYVMLYQSKWLGSQGMITMKNLTDQFRKRSQRRGLVRLFLNLFNWDHIEHVHPSNRTNIDDVLHDNVGQVRNTLTSKEFGLVPDFDQQLGIFEKISKFFTDFSTVYQKCPITIHDSTHSLQYNVEIPDLVMDRVLAVKDELNTRALCEVGDFEVEENVDMESYNGDCDADLKVVDIVGDGNCLYNCFVELNLFPNISVCELKRRLRYSPFFSEVAQKAALRGDTEFARSLEEDKVFGNEFTLLLIAKTFSLNICVHSITSESALIYRLQPVKGGAFVHLRLCDLHYDLLVPDIVRRTKAVDILYRSEVCSHTMSFDHVRFEAQHLVALASGQTSAYVSEFTTVPKGSLDGILEVSYAELLTHVDIIPAIAKKALVLDPFHKGILKPIQLWQPSVDIVVTRDTKLYKSCPDFVHEILLEVGFSSDNFCIMSTVSDVFKTPVEGQFAIAFADLVRGVPKAFSTGDGIQTTEVERINKIYTVWACLQTTGYAIFRITRPELLFDSLDVISTLFGDVRFVRPTSRPNNIIDGFLLCTSKHIVARKSPSIGASLNSVFYQTMKEIYCQTLSGPEFARQFVSDLCKSFSGGLRRKRTSKFCANASQISSESTKIRQLYDYLAKLTTVVLNRNFKSCTLNLSRSDFVFKSKPFEVLENNICYHCEESVYRRLLEVEMPSVEAQDCTYCMRFASCTEMTDIIVFIDKVVRNAGPCGTFVSNGFFNSEILISFCNFLRIYSKVEISLCKYQGDVMVRIDAFGKWRDLDIDDFELLGTSHSDFDPSFLKNLIEISIVKSRRNIKTTAVRSKADVLRLNLKSTKLQERINTGNHSIDMSGYVVIEREPNKDKECFAKIVELATDVVPEPVEIAEEAVETSVSDRTKAVFEFLEYCRSELYHSNTSIQKVKEKLLSFTTVRGKGLIETAFPNMSFIDSEKKTRNKVGLFSARKKVLKGCEPMVSLDEIRFVYDFVTDSLVSTDQFEKERRDLAMNRVAQYALFTNQVAHNQVTPIVDAVTDAVVSDVDSFVNSIQIVWTQACAGSGKTTSLVNEFRTSDLVVCPTVENRDSFRERLRQKYPKLSEDFLKTRVRTINGFLVDYKAKLSEITIDEDTRFLVDEAIMYHSGALLALCKLFEVKSMFCVGDRCQIPFTSRIDFDLKYQKIVDFVDSHNDPMTWSYRNTPDTVVLMQEIYSKYLPPGTILECRSKNQSLERSMVVRYVSPSYKFQTDILRDIFPKVENLTFETAEGKLRVKFLFFVREDMFGFLTIRPKLEKYCCTVNQFQGVEAEYIAVFRLSHNTKSIYNATDQCLVGLTRHTRFLVYVTVTQERDKLSSWISRDITAAMMKKHVKFSGGKTDGPVKYVTYMSIPSVEHMHGSSGTRIGFNEKSDIVLSKNSTISDVAKAVEAYGKVNTFDRNVIISSTVLDKFDQQRLKPLLTRLIDRDVRFFCSGKTSVLNGVVYSVMEKNGIEHVPNVSIEPVYDDDIAETLEPRVTLKQEKEFTEMAEYREYDVCGILQFTLSTLFPHSVYNLNYMDSWLTYNMDLDLAIDDVSFSTIKFVTREKKYDCMIPRLSFASPTVRQACLVESLIAVHKRNRNVPQLASGVSDYIMADKLFDSFVSSFLDERYYEPVHYGPAEVADWLAGQKTSVMDQVVGEFCIYDTDIKNYNLITKNNPKPNLMDEATTEFAAPQVVIFQEKDKNAVFCPIFRSIKRNIIKMMKDKRFVMFADMDPDEFARYMTEHHDPNTFLSSFSLEIDVKKFDKSQDLKVLLLECKIMRYFQVPEEFVELWYESHVESSVRDRLSSLKFKLQVQRRSGDGGTFIGNTIFLMAVLSYVFDMSKMDFATFSGDDSLLIADKRYLSCDSSKFSDLFNLDVKFFDKFEYYHFCSKFLIPVQDRWFFVPDPIKLLVRLSRCDLINWAHIEEYRISLCDSTKFFGDIDVVRVLKEAVTERYAMQYSFEEFIYSLRAIVTDPIMFMELFDEPLEKYPETGVVIPTFR
ncbi:RNA-dependent RNA polymerase [Solanum violifolium ringspot virus]|uniref:RNA-dependent RNA polymerase n=1 Tax=Solanum violifolium ringspot virus TaxID=3071295 RepID=UPI002483E6ED|nr:RNA-dependent RNA polymerase [Solanum violifolium ringspot virus]UNH55532.1 RNA-dependent RNA polymerase [Solanum violifolium ringspot virus]